MKKAVLIITTILIAMHARSQGVNIKGMPPANIYKTQDGKVIPADKLDSVMASFGGSFNMMHKDEEQGVTYLLPPSAAIQKAIDDAKTRLTGMIGKPAPEFILTDIKGKQYDLASLKGKVVVLNFWFTSCSGCIAEMPELNIVKHSFDASNVTFLALALDKSDQINTFLTTHQFEYNLVPDARETHKAYGVTFCPVSVVIGKDGIIKSILDSGEDVKDRLLTAINAAL